MVIWVELEAMMLTEIFQKKTNDFTCMYNPKNKPNVTKQKESHGYRGQTSGCQRGEGWRDA